MISGIEPVLAARVLYILAVLCAVSVFTAFAHAEAKHPNRLLNPDAFRPYIDAFNRDDEELYIQHIPDSKSWDFLRENIPFLECPDKDLERTYYFRWWTYRKHIKNTPDGFVITEFLPNVYWAGKHNTISASACLHLYEGRWLRDPKYLDDYSVFWFRKGGEPRRYSSWMANALLARSHVTGDFRLPVELLDDLMANYRVWESGFDWDSWELHQIRIGQRPNGLFWTIDDRDGGELSIGGHGFRPTLNSFMYGEAVAIAQIARRAGREDVARTYDAKAASLRQLVEERLWDEQAAFFKVLPERPEAKLVDVREIHGYTPWYFDLPEPGHGYEIAWKQLMDPRGFYAPFGPTTAEQRHPLFTISYEGHPCQWNGPSWPFATSIALTALANVLNDYEQDAITKNDYFEMLSMYARCHRRRQNALRLAFVQGRFEPVALIERALPEEGKSLKRPVEAGDGPCWIDENLNPYTGDWLARTRREFMGRRDVAEREIGKDYNHSTFCDLVISGLIGIRPREDDTLILNPLVPPEAWDWFCLDNVQYHGHSLTIVWDRSGERYEIGKGFSILSDGREIAHAANLGRISARLP